MHGRRTALRYSPSTPSPAGARSRGQSTVLPFGSGWSAPSPSWRVPGGRCVRVRGAHAIRGLKVPDTSVLCYLWGTRDSHKIESRVDARPMVRSTMRSTS